MAKKKFGSNGLNAVEIAAETVSASVSEAQESSQPVASAPVQSPEPEVIASPAIATKVEQTAQASAPVLKTEPVAVVQPASQPATQQKQSEEPAPETKVENTKGLNIPLPVSVYKRLSTMKLDAEDETLKSLGLKAIIEFLDKKGY